MEKTDLTKRYPAYYTASSDPELVELPAATYLSLCGKGDPSGAAYAENLQALYAVAYGLKFRYKALGSDFTVAKLEGLWWFDEQRFGTPSVHEAPTVIPRSEWEYRMLIRLPEYVGAEAVATISETVAAKKNLPLALQTSFFRKEAERAIQLLHTGPFDTEPASLAKLLDFSTAHGLEKNGPHHEIYLSDFRKTAPGKLRTILREPVK